MKRVVDFGEPWSTDTYAMYAWDRHGIMTGDNNEADFRVRGTGAGRSEREQKAIIRRVVACVNACAGMDDPAGEIAALKAAVAPQVRQERTSMDPHEPPGDGPDGAA